MSEGLVAVHPNFLGSTVTWMEGGQMKEGSVVAVAYSASFGFIFLVSCEGRFTSVSYTKASFQ